MKKVLVCGAIIGTGVLAFTMAQHPTKVKGALENFQNKSKSKTECAIRTVQPKTATQIAKENMILAQAELAEIKRQIHIAEMNVTQIEKRQSPLIGWLIKTPEEGSAENSLKLLRQAARRQTIAIKDSQTVYGWDKDVNADIQNRDMAVQATVQSREAIDRNNRVYTGIQSKKDKNNNKTYTPTQH